MHKCRIERGTVQSSVCVHVCMCVMCACVWYVDVWCSVCSVWMCVVCGCVWCACVWCACVWCACVWCACVCMCVNPLHFCYNYHMYAQLIVTGTVYVSYTTVHVLMLPR